MQGTLNDRIDYDTSVRYYRFGIDETGYNYINETTAINEIDAGRYDIANPLSQNEIHLKAVEDMRHTNSRDLQQVILGVRSVFRGNSFSVGDFASKWYGGVEHTTERYRDIFDREREQNNVIGSYLYSAPGVTRRRNSAFGNLGIAVMDTWDFEVAGRVDDYNDVSSTTSLNVGTRYQSSENFSIRASMSKGREPPNFYEMHGKGLYYPYIIDSKSCPTGTEGQVACRGRQIRTESRGSPNLEPDRSKNFSYGISASFGSFNLDANIFNLEIENAPITSAQEIVNLDAEGKLPMGSEVQRGRGDTITGLVVTPLNLAEEQFSGIELRSGYKWKTDNASFAVDLQWTGIRKNRERLKGGEWEDHNIPKERTSLTLRSNFGQFKGNWTIRNISAYANVQGSARYGSWTGHDLIGEMQNPFGYENLTISAGILNATNEDPPTDTTASVASGVNTSLYPVSGRSIFLNAKLLF